MNQIAETKIILLLLIPIINYFNFPAPTEQCYFFDLAATRKKILASFPKKNSLFSKAELLKSFESDYSSSIQELIEQKKNAKVVIINYPSNEKHFASFEQELAQRGQKITKIVLLTVLKYELILSLKNKYLICPICEKITKREESIHNLDSKGETKIFICPNDKEYPFALNEIEQFNEWVIEYYLLNTKKVVEKFLKQKITPIQINIERVEDIFTEEKQDQILKIIESL